MVSGVGFQVSDESSVCRLVKKRSDARRAKIDERKRTQVVRWSEAIEAQRSR